MTNIRLEIQVKVRRAKANEKAMANPKVREKVRTKVRRRRNLRPRRVLIQSEQLQLEGAMAHFPETAWLWRAGPTCGSSTKKTCLLTTIKMYFILHMANAIATEKPPKKVSERYMCCGQSQTKTLTCFKNVFCGNVDAISYVVMISSYGFQKEERFKFKCGALCIK